MKTKCLLIDDEPLAREIIADYVKNIENMELVSECSNAMEGFSILREKKIDLIFLDINMPQISGIDFIKSLTHPPKIIIISAHKEFALEGFELDVVDYLLKPVSFSRFLKAMDKYYLLSKPGISLQGDNRRESEEEFIYLKENKKVIKVYLKEIDYIEAMGEYCQVFIADRRIIPKMSIKTFEDLLGEKDFIRIHKSLIVPINKISAFSASTVEISKKKELPIGRSYKKAVLNALNYYGKVHDT